MSIVAIGDGDSKSPTPDEKNPKKSRDELLKYFIEVPREKWEHLMKSMQIRLECADGELRTGGFITDISGDVATNGIIKCSNFPPSSRARDGYREFPFKCADIKRIWKRSDRFSYIEIARVISGISMLADRNATQAKQITGLESKVNALESVLSKLVGDLKRASRRPLAGT